MNNEKRPFLLYISIFKIRKCELPENINSLPDFAQDELRAVW